MVIKQSERQRTIPNYRSMEGSTLQAIETTLTLISNVNSRLGIKSKRGRKAGRPIGTAGNSNVNFSDLVEVKRQTGAQDGTKRRQAGAERLNRSWPCLTAGAIRSYSILPLGHGGTIRRYNPPRPADR